jgi:hypothetical protein
MSRMIRRPSLEMTVACAALLIALGGTGIAAAQLVPRGSIGTPQLRNDAVTSAKIRDGSLQATDVAEGQLPPGPTGSKGDKGDKGDKGSTGERGPRGLSGAYTRAVVGPIVLPYSKAVTRVASLDITQAGTYLIWAKTYVDVDYKYGSGVRCELRTGDDADESSRYIEDGRPQTIVTSAVRKIAAPGEVTYECALLNFADDVVARHARITAVKVTTPTG